MPLTEASIKVLGKNAKLLFENGRPHHYLMLRLLLERELKSCTPECNALFHACYQLTGELQKRTGTFLSKEPGRLMPEDRTNEPWGNGYLWEFWIEPSAINEVALLQALDPVWFEQEINRIITEDYGVKS